MAVSKAILLLMLFELLIEQWRNTLSSLGRVGIFCILQG